MPIRIEHGKPVTLLTAHAYKAAIDGFVYAEVSLGADGRHLSGYVGSTGALSKPADQD